MNLLVILAGVADPKWPLPAIVDATTLAQHRAAHPLLSPFDEAALELALKLRADDPLIRIHALVGIASAQDPLLRHVAGFRLDTVEGLDLRDHPTWSAPLLARRLAAWIRALQPAPDLVLTGREFGDDDDGTVPALLAEACGLPLLSQTLTVGLHEGSVQVLRQQGIGLERRRKSLPVLAAVTNHTSNRLRHPLLKNVMAARKMSFELVTLPPLSETVPLRLDGISPIAPPARATACRMIEGERSAQVAELARALVAEIAE